MRNPEIKTPRKFGLSLSGGGYRAAAFHLGTLRCLHRLEVLGKVDYLSSVSGGAIIAASYCQQTKLGMSFPEFDTYFKGRLKVSIIGKVVSSPRFLFVTGATLLLLGISLYLILACRQPWLGLLILIALVLLLVYFQFSLLPLSDIIEKLYDEVLFQRKTLCELPARPYLIVNATNLQTGRLFYFTRDKMSDSSYDGSYGEAPKKVFKHEQFPVSRAVMCSSCFPVFFSPVHIAPEFFEDVVDSENVHPVLIDGGVYDNQGIHKLTHPGGEFKSEIVVVSDAGNILPFEGSYKNVFTVLLRMTNLFMNRIKLFQMMNSLYRKKAADQKDEIAYVTLGWNVNDLLPGFVRNVRAGNVATTVLLAHGIDDRVLAMNDEGFRNYIGDKIGIDSLLTRLISPTSIELARSVSTNLTALSNEQVESLAQYADLMTELQIRLYAPSILL